MNPYLTIQHPENNTVYNIDNPTARYILKRYIQTLYQSGGLFEKRLQTYVKTLDATDYETKSTVCGICEMHGKGSI